MGPLYLEPELLVEGDGGRVYHLCTDSPQELTGPFIGYQYAASRILRKEFRVLENELEVALEAARRAGGVLREGFGVRPEIKYKGEVDLVTETDERAEEAIREVLATKTRVGSSIRSTAPRTSPTGCPCSPPA